MIIVLVIVGLLFTIGIAFYVRTTQMPMVSKEGNEQPEADFIDLKNTLRPSVEAEGHSFHISATRKPDPYIINSPTLYTSMQNLSPDLPLEYDAESPYDNSMQDEPYFTGESFQSGGMGKSIGRGSRFSSEMNGASFFPPVGPSIFDNPDIVLCPNTREGDDDFPALVKCRLNTSDIEMTRQLSSGTFSSVWLGNYQDELVIVKQMNAVENIAEMFATEISVMSGLIHTNIIHFIGCTWTSRMDLCSVTEYISGGDLKSLLLFQGSTLQWANDKISIALDIAQALRYLHSLQPIAIYRVLKAQKVIVDDQLELVAKLGDFTISAACYDKSLQTRETNFVRWIAPEVLTGNEITPGADIYSFGVLLSELDTHKVPYEELQFDNAVIAEKIGKGELRPSFNSDCPQVIQQIADACLQHDTRKRPESNVLIEMLKQARLQLKEATTSAAI